MWYFFSVVSSYTIICCLWNLSAPLTLLYLVGYMVLLILSPVILRLSFLPDLRAALWFSRWSCMLCLIYPNCLIPPRVSKITCMLHNTASTIHLKLASDQVIPMLTIYLKKKKNHPEALFRKALPHHSINNPAQSPGFCGPNPSPPHPCTPTKLPEVVWDQRQAKDPGHWDLSAVGHGTGLKTVKWITCMAPYGSVKVHPWDLLSKWSRKTLSTQWCKFQGPLRLVYLWIFLQRIWQRIQEDKGSQVMRHQKKGMGKAATNVEPPNHAMLLPPWTHQ